MRLEGQNDRVETTCTRLRDRHIDNGAVSAMHPVKIADGDDAAAQNVRGCGAVAHHRESS
jgi:hypothetical protein